MSTPKERAVMTQKADSIIDEAASGDGFARDYLTMLARITRLIDDIYDQDHEVTREDLLTVLEFLFIKLPVNSFYIRHQDVLLSQHITMYNAWMAANYIEHGDETDRVYAHVWRETVNEVVPVVALLTGGYEHMTAISFKMRKLFKKQLGE